MFEPSFAARDADASEIIAPVAVLQRRVVSARCNLMSAASPNRSRPTVSPTWRRLQIRSPKLSRARSQSWDCLALKTEINA